MGLKGFKFFHDDFGYDISCWVFAGAADCLVGVMKASLIIQEA